MEPLDGKRLLRILLHFIFMLKKHYQKWVAWGGGIFFNPEGIIRYRYAWGFGWKEDNQEKAYGLFLGLTLAQKKGIKTIQLLGNAMVIIRHMIYASSAKNTTLNQIIKRSHGLIPSFEFVSFFHVLRGNNHEAWLVERRKEYCEWGRRCGSHPISVLMIYKFWIVEVSLSLARKLTNLMRKLLI